MTCSNNCKKKKKKRAIEEKSLCMENKTSNFITSLFNRYSKSE